MSYIIWDALPFDSTGNTVHPLFKELNTKLLSIGLIDYTQNNTIEIDKILINSTSTVSQYGGIYKICDIFYKLPVGNGKTLFEDIENENYKKIIKESYDSTEVYIKIELFVYNAINSVTYTRSSSNFAFGTKLYISSSENFNNNNLIDDTITGSMSRTIYNGSTRKCIINLTGNIFSIFWNDRSYYIDETTTSQYNWINNLMPQLFFSIYRENGLISINTRKPNYTNNYPRLEQSSSTGYGINQFHPLVLTEIINHKNMEILQNTKYPQEYMKRIQDNAPLVSDNSTVYIQPTYINLFNDMKINPGIARIYINSPPLPIYNNSVLLYHAYTYHKGERVKFQYYNVSLLYHKLKTNKELSSISSIKNSECSYFVLLEDYPVTTDHL